jgi:hypothetical protein
MLITVTVTVTSASKSKYHWHHLTVITGASKILAQPTPFIFDCCMRAVRRNVTTRSPHTPELEFLDEELIRRHHDKSARDGRVRKRLCAL